MLKINKKINKSKKYIFMKGVSLVMAGTVITNVSGCGVYTYTSREQLKDCYVAKIDGEIAIIKKQRLLHTILFCYLIPKLSIIIIIML